MRELFGVVLRARRRRLGLTQSQLAECLGMTQAKVSKLETGAARPSWEDVAVLDRAGVVSARLCAELAAAS